MDVKLKVKYIFEQKHDVRIIERLMFLVLLIVIANMALTHGVDDVKLAFILAGEIILFSMLIWREVEEMLNKKKS